MTLSAYLEYHDIPPSCVLALPDKERKAGQECNCEGVTHEKDWVKIRPKLSYGEKLDLAQKMGESAAAGLTWMVAIIVGEWSLKDTTTRLAMPIEGAKGEPLEISAATVYQLDEETADYISSLFDRKKPAGDGDAPKGAKRSRKR